MLGTYTYDGLGRRTLLTRGNGTTQTPGYDSAYNLASLAQTASNTAFNETLTFAHNPLGQSTTRTGSNAAYQWSPIAPATASYSRNGLNQYTAVAGTSFSYDARGNLTGDGTRTYAFDVYNRLTSVGGAATMTLAYDPAGRLYETAAASTTRFLYDGSALIGEFNSSGTLLRRTVQGADGEPLVWYEGAGTTDRRYLMTNEQGTVIAADASSGVTAYSYDDYGNPNAWNSPGTAPRQRYAGTMMLAEAQLYHMGARAYAPGIGRFLQTDPILFGGGVNLYAYTENDPVNAVDPSGLESQWVCNDKKECGWEEKVIVYGHIERHGPLPTTRIEPRQPPVELPVTNPPPIPREPHVGDQAGGEGPTKKGKPKDAKKPKRFWRDLDGCMRECFNNDPDVKAAYDNLFGKLGVAGTVKGTETFFDLLEPGALHKLFPRILPLLNLYENVQIAIATGRVYGTVAACAENCMKHRQ